MSRSDIVVRKAVMEDKDAIVHIFDENSYELSAANLGAIKEDIKEGRITVAVKDGRVVGFLSFNIRKDKKVTLYYVGVDAFYRRRGIGTRLVEELIRIAKEKSCKEIILRCPAWISAVEFYRKLNFRVVGEEVKETKKGKRVKLVVFKYEL